MQPEIVFIKDDDSDHSRQKAPCFPGCSGVFICQTVSYRSGDAVRFGVGYKIVHTGGQCGFAVNGKAAAAACPPPRHCEPEG
jgi:hypothetical protein